METVDELSELLSIEHPELALAVDKAISDISGFNYGVVTTEQNSIGRAILTSSVMKRANEKRIDNVEFYMSFFPLDLRAAFLIKISMKFSTLRDNWLKVHNAFADHTTTLKDDLDQVIYLHALFMEWIDDNLPEVMAGTYESRGGWF